MSALDRRAFLSSALGSVAALSLPSPASAQEKKRTAGRGDKAAQEPSVKSDALASLFLTWQQDPTAAGKGVRLNYQQ